MKEQKTLPSTQKEKHKWLPNFAPTKKAGELEQAENSGNQTEIEDSLIAREGTEKNIKDQQPKARPGFLKRKLNWPVYLKPTKKSKETSREEQDNGKTEQVILSAETLPDIKLKTESLSQPDVVVAKIQETNLADPVEPGAEKAMEKPLPTENADVPQALDGEVVYNGEVELAIAVPVDPAAVSKLYNYLQATPDMKVLYTRGSWDRGTVITVTLDKPLPFIGMVSKIPGLKITPGIPQKENQPKWMTGSLVNSKKKDNTRIYLILKSE